MAGFVDKAGVPLTSTRVAVFKGNLEDAVKKYSPPLEKINFGIGNTIKFASFEQNPHPYLLMVSQQVDKQVIYLEGMEYNCLLTVTSRFPNFNEQCVGKFAEETGILFGEAPQKLTEFMQNLNMTFVVFEHHGKTAIQILKKF